MCMKWVFWGTWVCRTMGMQQGSQHDARVANARCSVNGRRRDARLPSVEVGGVTCIGVARHGTAAAQGKDLGRAAPTHCGGLRHIHATKVPGAVGGLGQ